MPDAVDPSAPRPPVRPRRSRKFVLPDHHHDEQVDERAADHIEAFLEGPDASPRRRPEDDKRVRHPVELDTRVDWMAALRQEGARHARYGRPAAVLLIELRGQAPGAEADQLARTVADVICAAVREPDRVTRVGALSFRLLLPETRARAARSLVERLQRAFLLTMNGGSEDLGLAIDVASAPRTGSLEDAYAEAERRVAAANASVAAAIGTAALDS